MFFHFLKKLKKLTISTYWKYVNKPKKKYNLPGAVNLNRASAYFSNKALPLFLPKYEVFQNNLQEYVNNVSSLSLIKFGDGDYFFLNGIEEGSAKPGKRALSKNYKDIDLDFFRKSWEKIDIFTCEVPESDRKRFSEISQNRAPDYPAEYIYASVANRWFFSNLGEDLAVIGGNQKIGLIEELQKFKKYRDYLGLSKPFKTIKIPEKFACDNIEQTIEVTLKQVEASGARVFFLGVGHAKSALLPALSTSYPGVFIDIGSGIDALAGVVDIYRPYFGSWVNYQLNDRRFYSQVDYLQVQSFGKIEILK
jgi:hypothetical protein